MTKHPQFLAGPILVNEFGFAQFHPVVTLSAQSAADCIPMAKRLGVAAPVIQAVRAVGVPQVVRSTQRKAS